jgi:hypothetical protein
MDDENKVHPDFQLTSQTDLVLRSTDRVLFYLEKARLRYTCSDGFFSASSISAPSARISADSPPDIVDMTDANAESLAILVRYMMFLVGTEPTFHKSDSTLCSERSVKHIASDASSFLTLGLISQTASGAFVR